MATCPRRMSLKLVLSTALITCILRNRTASPRSGNEIFRAGETAHPGNEEDILLGELNTARRAVATSFDSALTPGPLCTLPFLYFAFCINFYIQSFTFYNFVYANGRRRRVIFFKIYSLRLTHSPPFARDFEPGRINQQKVTDQIGLAELTANQKNLDCEKNCAR
jgi:hypothetical protein